MNDTATPLSASRPRHAAPGPRHWWGGGLPACRRVPAAVRRRRLIAVLAVAVLVVVVAWVGIAGGPGVPPQAVITVTLVHRHDVPTADPALPWAGAGESAVAIPALGYADQSGAEVPVSVASMTKVMTAYVVLRDHPLANGSNGPNITVNATEAANFTTDLDTTQASIEIQSGEVLSERQAVDGMLVHSANDLAYTLALWDAGSLPAFLAKMNETANGLGMTHTHFSDASGYTPHSQSTASDLLKVTSAAMAFPAFAQAVAMPTINLPLSGQVGSYTPLLPGGPDGTPGVVGVKSGFTTAAGGGDVLAYQTTVGGQPLTILAAVTSQQGPEVLDHSGHLALALTQAAAGAVQSVPVIAIGAKVGTASVSGVTVPVVTTEPATLLGWPGQHVRQVVVVTHHPKPGSPAGSLVGTALFTLGEQQVAVPVRTGARLGHRS